jgi:hypothetical protein
MLVRKVVDETNNIRVKYGLTPDFRKMQANPHFQKAGLPNGYKYYVPLRGIIEEDMLPNDLELQRLRTGVGFKLNSKEDLTAMGRDKLANAVVEHVILQNEVSVVRAHKNQVGNSLYNLVNANRDMFKGILEIVEKAPTIRRVGKEDGIVRLMPDANYMNSDEYFVTKIGGENKVIKIIDPRLARILNGNTGYGDEGLQKVVNFIGGYTRLMSRLATGLNPEFWMKNTPRDVMLASININQYGIPGLSDALVKNWIPAWRAAKRANASDWNYVKTGEEKYVPPVTEDDKMYAEFLEDGGFTGYLGLHDLETRIADINKQITKGEGSKLAEGIEVVKRFGDFVESTTTCWRTRRASPCTRRCVRRACPVIVRLRQARR